MKPPFPPALCLLLSLVPTTAALADEQPSVLVTTAAVRRGDVADTVTAYGTAAPAPGATTSLSLMRAGQIVNLAVSPGQSVRKGERLLDFGADPAALMAWEQAVSALALARDERTHTAQLQAQQLATRAQLAQADKAVSDAQAAVDAQRRENGDKAVETLTAPFDGIVTSIAVGTGERVQPGASLVTLARADGLSVMVGVEPGDKGKLTPDEKVRLDPLDGGAPVEGTVHVIGGMLDPKTRLIDVVVAAPVGTLLQGEAFRATITVGQLEGWLVPRDAVLSDDKGAYVFQVAGGKAVRVDVRITGTAGDMTVLAGKLNPQLPLVTQGNYQLADGAAVRDAGSKS